MAAAVMLLSACGVSSGDSDASTTTETQAPTSVVEDTITRIEPSASTSTTTATPDTLLLVVGDWGSGSLPEGAVAGAMQRYAEGLEVEALLTTGDNLYSDDAEFLLHPYEWVEDQGIPWWITWGNHDVESETRIEAVHGAFGPAPRWARYEWGAVDVIVLDSNEIDSDRQLEFLSETLQASDRPTILAFHHPVYSCSLYGPTVAIHASWVPLLDDDVIAVLNGHEHSYQRFAADGITYVVTGGGGSDIRPLEPCPSESPTRLAGAELHHFVVLTQTTTSIELAAIDVNGDVIDEANIAFP